ncbi:MAG TPA: sigma 54-interacting transcriptional regulator [Labilithrix sp.]|nr:sigma 54-interacting transcriptional regulator [Labilithrix sp.]
MSDPPDPSTLAHASPLRPARAGSFEIRVTAGPDAGQTVTVSARSPGRVLIGTSEACHLRLTDRRTSRRHLAVEATERGLRIGDLGSTNGTRIGGLRIVEALCEGGELVTLGDSTLRVEVDHAEVATPDVRMAFGPLLGASLAMRRLYRTCDALAATTTAVLIEGERGTGKATLAAALHLASGGAAPGGARPFVVVEGMALGEVFAGGESGESLITEAARGTLFVREVGDVPLDAQLAFASFVAGAPARGVRIIVSTERNLDAAVEAGTFLEELAHELAARIELPPLRDRRGDVALLAEHFCRELGARSETIATKKLAALVRQPYPENVTSLRSAIAHLLADAGAARDPAPATSETTATTTPEALGLETGYRDLLIAHLPFAEAKQRLVDRFASAYVTFAVAAHGGHVARAAAASGLAPRYFNLLRARSRDRDPAASED